MELTEQEVFFREGILLKKQAFSEEEAEVLKVEARSRKNQKDFLFSTDSRELLISRIRTALQETFPGSDYRYIGESVATHHQHSGGARIFHRDIRGDSSSWSYDAQQPPLVRCGIFFNNHRDYSYGTKFIRGSHRRSPTLGICGFVPDEYKNARKWLGSALSWNNLLPVNPFKMLNLPAEKGDLGIWSLRTVHSGYFRRLKTLPDLVLPPICGNTLPDSLFREIDEPRTTIFATFGTSCTATKNYIEQRQEMSAIKNAVSYEELFD